MISTEKKEVRLWVTILIGTILSLGVFFSPPYNESPASNFNGLQTSIIIFLTEEMSSFHGIK